MPSQEACGPRWIRRWLALPGRQQRRRSELQHQISCQGAPRGASAGHDTSAVSGDLLARDNLFESRWFISRARRRHAAKRCAGCSRAVIRIDSSLRARRQEPTRSRWRCPMVRREPPDGNAPQLVTCTSCSVLPLLIDGESLAARNHVFGRRNDPKDNHFSNPEAAPR